MADYDLVPHLSVRGAAEAIEFYKKAFGFTETHRMPTPEGKILHATMMHGPFRFFLADEFPSTRGDYCKSPATLGGSTIDIYLGVPDVDKAFQRAVDAGAKVVMPVADMFWGARYGKVIDPFGHIWSLATQKEVVAPEEAKKRMEELFAKKK